MTTEPIETAAQLRGLRHQTGWSQAELATRGATSQSAVARYETGAAVPSLATLSRLVGAMGHRLVVTAEPVPEEADVLLAAELLRMPPAARLRALARYAALRDRVEVDA